MGTRGQKERDSKREEEGKSVHKIVTGWEAAKQSSGPPTPLRLKHASCQDNWHPDRTERTRNHDESRQFLLYKVHVPEACSFAFCFDTVNTM